MKIAIVGAGTGGTKLIELFSEIREVELAYVIDKNMQSPGIDVARKLGIRCSAEIEDIDHSVDYRSDWKREGSGNFKVEIRR